MYYDAPLPFCPSNLLGSEPTTVVLVWYISTLNNLTLALKKEVLYLQMMPILLSSLLLFTVTRIAFGALQIFGIDDLPL